MTTTCTCHGLTDPRIANASNAPHHPKCAITLAGGKGPDTDEGALDELHETLLEKFDARLNKYFSREVVTSEGKVATPAAGGPYTYFDKSKRYHAANGRFASLATVTAWTACQAMIGLLTAPTASPIPHGLYEAHVATKDDAPIRTTPTPSEQRHTDSVERMWGPRVWDSEDEGQAQYDYTMATL